MEKGSKSPTPFGRHREHHLCSEVRGGDTSVPEKETHTQKTGEENVLVDSDLNLRWDLRRTNVEI